MSDMKILKIIIILLDMQNKENLNKSFAQNCLSVAMICFLNAQYIAILYFIKKRRVATSTGIGLIYLTHPM